MNDEIDEDVFDCAETAKAGYGPYKNVMLTDDELAAWKGECPQWESYINLMSNYLKSKGESYADCLAALRSWYLRDCRKRENSADSQFAAPLTASHSGASYDLERVKANSLKVPQYVKKNKETSPAAGDV